MIRVADYIVQRLYDSGVKHIFNITGRGTLFLSDALARHEKMKSIATHHEQGAAFAAVAYAQHNEKIGACLVSTGCASTNTITGLLCAWQDNVPCIFVSGQNKLSQTSRHTGVAVRTYGQQEMDIVRVVESLTKYAVMVEDPEKIAYEIDRALYMANEGRKGPVWIDVPLDIQNMRVKPEMLERFVPENKTGLEPRHEDLKLVAEALREAKRPVLLLGSGVSSAHAIPELEQFLETCPMPVTFASSAVDAYGADRTLSIGAVGSLGATRAGNFAVQNADLVLVIGCRLSTVTTGDEYEKFARAAKVIVIDVDAVEHSKNTVTIDHLILCDAKKFLAALLKENIVPAWKDWIEKCLHWKTIFPKCEEKYKKSKRVDLYYLGEVLSHTLPDEAVLVTDSGLTELIIPSTVSFKKGQRCIHPSSQGSMGYALPASVGAHYSHGGDVIAVIGDGSIMMNLQELETIRFLSVPVKIIVVNNSGYAVIRMRQAELFRERTIGTDASNGLGLPALEKVARCFDIPYVKIDDSSNLAQKLERVLKTEGPVLCEILTVENQEYIRNSHALNSKKRAVRRPLEDQAPFVDRKLFLSEMIIEPIDQ